MTAMLQNDLVTAQPRMSLLEKLGQVNWLLILLICGVASVGFAMLYSAGGGNLDPWASRQMLRFGIGMTGLLITALIDIRLWVRAAYPFYFAVLALLIGVEIMGVVGMGAQRWIDLGFMQLQPSELMKVAIVLALARYFHGLALEDVHRPANLLIPAGLILLPAALVMRQPDLGTAMTLCLVGGAIFFLAGVRLWKFVAVLAAGVAAVPIAWQFLREYQKNRILTFLNPETDPLGAGYHILQSKIALGSGGLFGKGFLQGTQSHLNFLPEKQTDFIFTVLAEEFGLIGGLGLLTLFALLLLYGTVIGLRSRSHFGRLLALGLSFNLFVYVFINIGMVMGLLPVVGVPLPLISYGGTAMLTVLFGFGLIISVFVHRDVRISRRQPTADW